MTTMEDVARAANVSVATVSHVLNGTRKVNAETARAVHEAVKASGYVPNSIARALAGAVSNTIGVALSASTNHYFGETIRAIEAACKAHGVLALISDTHDDADQALSAVQALHQRRVDGILLVPSRDPQQRVVAYLQQNQIPCVLMDRSLPGDLDYVGVENRQSLRELTLHLIAHGHSRVGLISGADGLSTTDERIEGYREALTHAGLTFDPALVWCGNSTIESARVATSRLLKTDRPPTAIVTANNLMTIGTMQALRDARIDVPRDMALVGFDDFDWADYFQPRLTVMEQPLERLGARAVELLMKRIAEPDRAPQAMQLPPIFRIRNSCGCS